MGVTEWVLLIVVVILIPLAIAVAVTLWSLEQARQRNRRNRPGAVRRVAAQNGVAGGSNASSTSRGKGKDDRTDTAGDGTGAFDAGGRDGADGGGGGNGGRGGGS